MSERVIALDPGERTGWASAVMDVDSLVITGTGVFRSDLMNRRLALWQGVMGPATARDGRPGPLERRPSFDVIVAESWRPRRDDNGKMDWIEGSPMESVQHIGAIRFIADLSGATYKEYPPKQKPVWVASMPPKLKALDDISNEQHDRDARMHLWGYFFEEWFSGEGDPEEYVQL